MLWHWPDPLGTGCTLRAHSTPHHIPLSGWSCRRPMGRVWTLPWWGQIAPAKQVQPSPAHMLLCGTAQSQSLHSPTPVPTLSGAAGPLWEPLTNCPPQLLKAHQECVWLSMPGCTLCYPVPGPASSPGIRLALGLAFMPWAVDEPGTVSCCCVPRLKGDYHCSMTFMDMGDLWKSQGHFPSSS